MVGDGISRKGFTMKTQTAVELLRKHGFRVEVLPRGRCAAHTSDGSKRLTWSNGGLSGSGMMTRVQFERKMATGQWVRYRPPITFTNNAAKVKYFIFCHDYLVESIHGLDYRLRWDESVPTDEFGKRFVLCFSVIGRNFRLAVPDALFNLALDVHKNGGVSVLIDAMQDAGVEVFVQA